MNDVEAISGNPVSTSNLLAGPARVLLIDDDSTVHHIYGAIIQDAGFALDMERDGGTALVRLAERHYDAIVTDIRLPGMSGIELLRAIRQQDLDVPVLVMSGEPSVDTAAQAVEYGALQYLIKPVSREDLERSVKRAVRLHRMALARLRAADVAGHGLVRATDTMGLHTCLDSALQSLWMAFQPIVRAKERAVYGYEALLRTGEPTLGNPGAVLEVAQRLGRLDEVGRAARAQASQAMVQACDEVVLFVNLHPHDLHDPELTDPSSPLGRIARSVVLEVTERAALGTGDAIKNRISAIRELGFRIAIDDLGAGYSGLSSFALLEPDLVKLDLSLVRDVHLSRTKQRLIRSMTLLAKDMNVLIVAEGIESRAEQEKLIELGCDLLQGFLFAKPGSPFPSVEW